MLAGQLPSVLLRAVLGITLSRFLVFDFLQVRFVVSVTPGHHSAYGNMQAPLHCENLSQAWRLRNLCFSVKEVNRMQASLSVGYDQQEGSRARNGVRGDDRREPEIVCRPAGLSPRMRLRGSV